MTNRRRITPAPHPAHDPDPAVRQALLSTLGALLDQLAEDRGRASGPRNSATRWQDDEYSYIEIDMPLPEGLGVDLCFHQGRVFIRVER